ncbi:unnamed protein product [[Actinomadura] parvosata subsp. kistnae]|nr:unnamed protein product [Actinomadura parvosata subsp. kistnae]
MRPLRNGSGRPDRRHRLVLSGLGFGLMLGLGDADRVSGGEPRHPVSAAGRAAGVRPGRRYRDPRAEPDVAPVAVGVGEVSDDEVLFPDVQAAQAFEGPRLSGLEILGHREHLPAG